MSGTSLSERISWAEANLNRQLDWIGRHDSRIAIVFGICVAMLGFWASEIKTVDNFDAGSAFFSVIAVAEQIACLLVIYRSYYPRTKSPGNSLLFFGDIAQVQATEHANSFCGRTEKEHLHDLCEQTHINASILVKKFKALKSALFLLLTSTPFWVIAIAMLREAGATQKWTG